MVGCTFPYGRRTGRGRTARLFITLREVTVSLLDQIQGRNIIFLLTFRTLSANFLRGPRAPSMPWRKIFLKLWEAPGRFDCHDDHRQRREVAITRPPLPAATGLPTLRRRRRYLQRLLEPLAAIRRQPIRRHPRRASRRAITARRQPGQATQIAFRRIPW